MFLCVKIKMRQPLWWATKPLIVWSNKASASFRSAYDKNKEDSFTNAEKVKEGIAKIDALNLLILRIKIIQFNLNPIHLWKKFLKFSAILFC